MTRITAARHQWNQDKLRELILQTTSRSSIYWLRAQPDMDSPYWPELREEYGQLCMDIATYNISHSHSKAKTTGLKKYHITWTHAPDKLSKPEFKQAVLKQLNRETFTHVTYSFEHEEDNIHCHSICESIHDLSEKHFKSHIAKAGNIRIQRVHVDNGILAYIEKESEAITLK